jgi:hypothetical protein
MTAEQRAAKAKAIEDVRQREEETVIMAPQPGDDSGEGRAIIRRSECIGPVINGECRGNTTSNGIGRPKCYGNVINGRCIGAQY